MISRTLLYRTLLSNRPAHVRHLRCLHPRICQDFTNACYQNHLRLVSLDNSYLSRSIHTTQSGNNNLEPVRKNSPGIVGSGFDPTKLKETDIAITKNKDSGKNDEKKDVSNESTKLDLSVADQAPEKKLTLMQKVKKELLHYYHGIRLLLLDVKIASGLCLRVLGGNSLTRRERNQLVRTVADIFRMVPFAVFIIIPFMEFLIPFYIKLFPFMLPSTFKEAKTEEAKVRQRLRAKLGMAQFLQETLEKNSTVKAAPNSPTLDEFTVFMKNVRESGKMASTQDIVKFSQLFEDQLTMESLDYKLLKGLCQLLELPTIGPSNLLRFQIWMRVRQLKVEDQLLAKEGVDQIPPFELQSLCRERGMRSLGLSEERLRQQLSQWLVLHLEKNIPISLLLLSRTMYVQDHTLPPAKQIQMAILNLPEAASEDAKLRAADSIPLSDLDPKAKFDMLKKEQESIKAERKAKKKEEVTAKTKEKEDMAKTFKKEEEFVDPAKTLVDKASVISDSKPPEIKSSSYVFGSSSVPPIEVNDLLDKHKDIILEALKNEQPSDDLETTITKEDLGEISRAISQLDEPNKALQREALEDIQEQVLLATQKQAILDIALRDEKSESLKKSHKGAQILAGRVDKMLGEMGSIMDVLLKQKTNLLKEIEIRQVMAKHEEEVKTKQEMEESIQQDKERVIEVNDLLLALRRIQKVPDDTKWQRILQVMDEDRDGKIELQHVLDVIELLGSDNVKVNSKDMQRILDMLNNERTLDMASKSKNATSSSDPSSPSPPHDNNKDLK